MAIVKRTEKGSELTHVELDGNFTDLDTRVTTLEGSGGISLASLSVTSNAVGVAALSYNNATGVFTYTPPDLTSFVTSSGGGISATGVQPGSVTSGGGLNLSITGGVTTDAGQAGGLVNINAGTGGAGGLNGDINIGTATTEQITIGSGANNVDFPSGTAVDFTGATVTGLTVTETDPVVGAITGIVKADGSGNISAAVAGTDYSTFDGQFSSLTSKPTTLAGYGITDATSSNSPAFTGIPDFTGSTIVDMKNTAVDFTGSTITGLTVTETDPIVGAITGIVKADGAGNISAAVAGTDYLTTVAFADLTGKPTTLAGYGITDAATLNNMAPTGAVDFTGATTIDFNTVTINNLDYSDISNAPTTLAGYGITDALANVVEDTTPQLGGDLDCQGFNITMDNGIISSSAGNLQISSFNYVTIDSANDGQIEIGRASGAGDVIIGKESNGTSVSFEGVATFDERAKFDKGVEEKFATTNGATGVTALDCATGHVHYLTAPAGDITANFTNLSLTAEYATNITIIIDQGNTQYEVTAVQIGGVAQTIIWQGNSAPTGTANGVDSFSFTILNDGGTYVVLGQMVAFGGV